MLAAAGGAPVLRRRAVVIAGNPGLYPRPAPRITATGVRLARATAVRLAAPSRRVANYQRREPERTALHGLLDKPLATFLALANAHNAGDGTGGLPRFVQKELREFLSCGILGKGFARFRCQGCGLERLVAQGGRWVTAMVG